MQNKRSTKMSLDNYYVQINEANLCAICLNLVKYDLYWEIIIWQSVIKLNKENILIHLFFDK